MTTVKQKKAAAPSRTAVAAKPEIPSGKSSMDEVQIALIDISPLNYRKYYDPEALESFASELALHGIISPVTLRKMESGRYELVAGERRYRAAKIAGLEHLPAMIRILSDEQVQELQLAENIQRENPHPMHESQAIAQMQSHGHSIEEIAGRLGKSKGFIYSRIKLAGLILSIQEIFLAGKFNLQEAFDIASISASSQEEFYNDYCKDWQKKTFKLNNLGGILNRFRYDLNRAPFNTKDKGLLPDMGACTKCPFNSATLKSLFPELAKEARCTNKECYQQKCTVHLQRTIDTILEESVPVAIICNGAVSEEISGIILANPLLKELPVHERYDITVFNQPEAPERDDFKDPWAENEEEAEFDEDGFSQAKLEYEADLEEYTLLKQNGKASIGLYISGGDVQAVLFSTERQHRSGPATGSGVTAKQVQEAIKGGTVTAELLEGEIERLNSREKRSKEIDREKVQVKLHEQFTRHYAAIENNATLTDADLAAARLIIFNSLDYHTRNKVLQTLFAAKDSFSFREAEETYEVLKGLSEQQHTYLVRMALACKSESKNPGNDAAYTLYQVAQNAGLDVQAIEQEQQAVMEKRELRLKERLAEMQLRLEAVNKKAA